MRTICILAGLACISAYTVLEGTTGAIGTRVYAEGVNPPAHQRADPKKVVWAYVGPQTQGAFGQVYSVDGKDGLVTADDLLNTPVNHIAFILNIDVGNSSKGWFAPGKNNTGGCGQYQTYDIPFGYECKRPDGQPHGECDDSASLSKFQGNLKKLHDTGMTITLTLGSWCTQLPVKEGEAWTANQFTEFVDYFEEIKKEKFGGYLDGIDFDWEGFCSEGCLQGTCACGWDDKECGLKTADELAAGVYWQVSNKAMDASGNIVTQTDRYQCWVLPTKHTIQVMTGITYAMKQAGHVVTLVPMSTSMYSGDDDVSKTLSRNDYVKYRKQNVGSGGAEVDLLELTDGVLLQWYSGFDAALCRNSDDPMACACDNMPADDYPNVVDAAKTLVHYPWQTQWNLTGNSFPTTFPLRCQACGKNVMRKDNATGKWSWGEYPCTPEDEQYYTPCAHRDALGANDPACVASHNNGEEKYVAAKKTEPHWFPKGMEISSKCPRGIDCPDWRYEGEKPYARQIKLLKSLSSVIDLGKIAIGFETLGTDVLVQMQAYQDHGLPWSTSNPKKHQWPVPYEDLKFYEKCTQNMTVDNYKQEKRCASAIGWQQWGPKFDHKEIVGLEKAVKEQLGKDLSGVGLFTLDGVIARSADKTQRMWCEQLMMLNQTYMLPCSGANCGMCGKGSSPLPPGPGPAPSPGPVTPTPAPGPAGTKYLCDTAALKCVPGAGGTQTKDQCEAVCKHPGPAPTTPTPAPPGPAPSGKKYLCDTANLKCVEGAGGTQSKDQCEAVCHHFA